ncbi:histidine kinase [Aquimarina sp. LLG6339-5]|uniref:tetratricopeptide repeat-containing sensor histidine kinase n=1 Tax=Aquimarina sp. LLG6339-5 TaxID=3160830 RepID=UPI003865BE61
MKKILTLLLLFLVTQSYTQEKIYTQTEVDSFKLRGAKPPQLTAFKSMLESDENLVGWMNYYRQKCRHHLIQKEGDSILIYGEEGLQFLENKKLSPEKSKEEGKYLKEIYLYIGIALADYRYDYRKSTEYLLKSLEHIEIYPDYNRNINPWIIANLAGNYLGMGDKKKAFEYRLALAKDTAYMAIPQEAAPTYNHLGMLYNEFGKKDSALYYYHKSIENRLKYDHFSGIRAAYNNMGDLFREQGNLDSTLYYYTKSKEVLDDHPIDYYNASKYFTLSNYHYVLLKKGNINKAIHGLTAVLDTISEVKKITYDIKSLKSVTMDYLIEAYRENKQPEKALEVALQKSRLLEKFHQQVLDEKLRELNIAYEVKEKEASIEKLEAVSEEQETIINQRNIITIALLVFIMLLIGIAILIFRQRKLKNKYETANLEQRLLRSQLNPHFVFNALNTVSSLASKNSENTSSYIAKLSGLIRLILKNSREEFISLEDEIKSLEDYLGLQSNFSQKFNYNIGVDSAIEVEEIYIPPMFIQPFIENAIEHGLQGVANGIITIAFEKNDNDTLITCSITDNGIGLTKASELANLNDTPYESFSGKIIKERLQIYAKSLNKKAGYKIQEVQEGTGTEVILVLPYIQDT